MTDAKATVPPTPAPSDPFPRKVETPEPPKTEEKKTTTETPAAPVEEPKKMDTSLSELFNDQKKLNDILKSLGLKDVSELEAYTTRNKVKEDKEKEDLVKRIKDGVVYFGQGDNLKTISGLINDDEIPHISSVIKKVSDAKDYSEFTMDDLYLAKEATIFKSAIIAQQEQLKRLTESMRRPSYGGGEKFGADKFGADIMSGITGIKTVETAASGSKESQKFIEPEQFLRLMEERQSLAKRGATTGFKRPIDYLGAVTTPVSTPSTTVTVNTAASKTETSEPLAKKAFTELDIVKYWSDGAKTFFSDEEPFNATLIQIK